MNYWLMKSEPDLFGIDDLKNRPGKTEPWDGVRNYQARNYIRDELKKGDLAFFYHSNCKIPGIVGVMAVADSPSPDTTAFDKSSKYYDPKSDPVSPRWLQVTMRYNRKLKRTITLEELRSHKVLGKMKLLQRGNRLSIMPVTGKEWDYILTLE